MPDGKAYSKVQLLLHAIDEDPSSAAAFVRIANLLSVKMTIPLMDGRVMSRRQLLTEALRLDPSVEEVLFKLGVRLTADETAELRAVRSAMPGSPPPSALISAIPKSPGPAMPLSMPDLATMQRAAVEAMITPTTFPSYGVPGGLPASGTAAAPAAAAAAAVPPTAAVAAPVSADAALEEATLAAASAAAPMVVTFGAPPA